MKFKRMSQIYSRLVDHTITTTNELNDFSVGSAMRSLYESISIELEQYYILTRENMQEAIERGVYSSFGFERRRPTKAYGLIQITFHNKTREDRIVPRGSRFSAGSNTFPQEYETLDDYTIPRGSLVVDIEAHCTRTGSYGNVPKGAIDTINSPLSNVKGARNTTAIQTGQDEEPLEELRTRFRAYIKSLSRATVPALEYGTREIEGVTGVYINEQTGLVTVFAHDRNGELSDSLAERIKQNLENYRPAGIEVRISSVQKSQVSIDLVVTVTDKTAISGRFRREIEDVIKAHLNSRRTSQNLILSDLTRVIMNVDNYLIHDVEFKELEGNVNIQGHEVIRAGEVKVTLQ